ncbi:hypothetical protein [Rhizobium leucaenae]|uniref:Amidohydrolase n=1 Tax=Rhizobium leucaenae TaxID=29450 RepID=A0A7W7A0F2_9HYPH|nr:hypothetical protein [Rhizobium leucaenae]MBB4571662.1 hypothetical protein [Rhizobium leucaenae]
MLNVGQDQIALKPHPQSAPKGIIVPKAVWDCHAHVVGDPNVFPFIEDRAYTPVAMTDNEFLNVWMSQEPILASWSRLAFMAPITARNRFKSIETV